MRNNFQRFLTYLCASVFALSLVGCSDDEGVDSDEEARRAYLGLDTSIEKSLNLGFDGFNAASSANIDPQMTTGDLNGTLTITGQVDQGASDNKTMRLYVGMVDYSDGKVTIDEEQHEIDITYNTDAEQLNQPFLSLTLHNVPTGTFDGTLTGVYHLTGDIEGDVTLNLTMTGSLMDAGNGLVGRVPNSTHITGTANSGDGTYDVDVTI
jgi:hypothetical protein